MWKTENPSSLKFTQQLVLRSVFLLSKWKLKKWKVACLFIWKNSEFYFTKMTCNTRCWLAKPEPNHLVQNKCRVCYCCSTVRKNWVAVPKTAFFDQIWLFLGVFWFWCFKKLMVEHQTPKSGFWGHIPTSRYPWVPWRRWSSLQ